MGMQRIELGLEARSRVKHEAVGDRPYAERVSTSLALLLLALREGRGDYFPVLDEIDFLERIKRSSKTKPPEPFQDPRLRGLWHKHYSSARHIPQNISLRWGLRGRGNQALDHLLGDVARDCGDDQDVWQHVLARKLAVGAYGARAGRLTGEWIIYAMHEGKNFYLTFSTHEEGKEPEGMLARLRQECAAEWPFLFGDLTA